MRRLTLLVIALAVGCSDYDIRNRGDQVDDPGDTDTDTPVDTGPQPDIALSPALLDFGWLPVDCLSDRQTITVENEGDADLVIDAITVDGDGKSAFSVYGTGDTLSPGDTMEFDVSFTPSAWVEYDVDVTVHSNDPDESEAVVEAVGVGAEDMIYEESFTQSSPSSVDVLWVIDNSGSMSGAVDDLGYHLPVFIDNFVRLGLDWQMAIVTTDMDTPEYSGQVQGGLISDDDADPVGDFVDTCDAILSVTGSASERGMEASYAALEDPGHAVDLGLVRPDGTLAVIIITDEEDDSDHSKSSYVSWLDGYKGDPALTSFSAMAGPKKGMMPCNDMSSGISAEPTPTYWYLTDNTGGFYTEICDMDFNEVLTYLSFTAAGMLTSFPLAEEPSNIGQIKVTVAGESVPYSGIEGFTYDADSNSIVFHGDTVPDPEEEVIVSYPVATECY